MLINVRIKNGWLSKVENKGKYFCDRCGENLWRAPDGKTVYCNGNWEECIKRK